ncbi:MAG: ABC transporter substrate-binding protein [Paludibacteraceae bacterium]|nr:ABC transporter substrate-binding protein [Paludibacteraceae bacterium]
MTRKAVISSGVLWLVSSLLLMTGCKKDEPFNVDDLEVCRVAVVLPFGDNMKVHWEQCLRMCAANQLAAFSNMKTGVRIEYEWFDETDPNIEQIAYQLARREDITAVIGGLYSSKALILANQLSKTDKPLFTVATTEQSVRAYSSWGNLWAMTETDITQCEVLLSKAMQYNAKSVALIAQDGSAYGQTFIDWFAFQAQELGVENKGVYTYTSDVTTAAEQALESGAEYIVCAPSEISEVGGIIRQAAVANPHGAHLLFSDIAHGNNVIEQLGKLAEGVEGVCFGSDPESGFDVAYEVRFGMQPTVGEAQVYDAAMLIGLSAYLQQLHQGWSFRTAMRYLVDGREEANVSWRSEDMERVARMLQNGNRPDMRGASGSLDFDAKVYTNVLHTVYDNFLIYQQRYVYLDYNSTDGSRRSDPTLSEWNWKASQMQDVSGGVDRTYPALDKRWALLVASSSGWENYRHQVDVLNIYQQLLEAGYDDEHIVLIMQDDLAFNPANPQQGVLYTRMNGVNVYHDVQVDYRLSDISPSDITRILAGQSSPTLPHVIDADEDDNVFFFWSGHGLPGFLCWMNQSFGISSMQIQSCLSYLQENRRYRKLIGCFETCYSGSVAQVADDYDGVLFFTAANESETSKADEYNYQTDVWMSNRFTATLQDCMINDRDMLFSDLYYRLFQSTVGSHVCVFGIKGFGSLYTSGLNEIL